MTTISNGRGTAVTTLDPTDAPLVLPPDFGDCVTLEQAQAMGLDPADWPESDIANDGLEDIGTGGG